MEPKMPKMPKRASMRPLCFAAALAPALVVAPVSVACSGDPAPPPPAVFSAGVDASGWATVWRDGEPYAWIEEGGAFHSVWVQGRSVHAAGVAPNDRPLYWSDAGGGKLYRELGAGQGMATAVCTDAAGRAYIAGWDASGGRVWRGAGDALHSFGRGARPCAMAVDGDVVYTAGWDYNGGAVIWRDGARLEGGGIPGEAAYYAVGVSNGAIYAAGESDGLPVWIRTSDDAVNVLPGYGDGVATSLHISGGRISMAGWDDDGGKVWAGPAAGDARGVSVRQGLGAAAEPESVFALGGDVYAGGWGGMGGMVWRNGSPVRDLGAGSDVYSIFVVQ
jgi:hypothetical protein